MRRSFSEPLIPALLGAALMASPARAQAPDSPGPVLASSNISVSRESAQLRLELEGGREVVLELAPDGAVRMNGERVGSYERHDALDQSWRDLLQKAMEAPSGTIPQLLVSWTAPAESGGVGRRLDHELESALDAAAPSQPAPAGAEAEAEGAAAGGAAQAPAEGAAADARAPAAPADAEDSIRHLNEQLQELQRVLENPNAADRRLDELQNLDIPALKNLRRDLEVQIREQVRSEMRSDMGPDHDWTEYWTSPWRRITRGIGAIFSTLMVYAIMVGMGFLTVFFGRKYLETIADTARTQTLRSGLVGLAGSFLVLPAYVLGLLVLAVSIVGIPLLLVYAPLFPVAVVLAVMGGYLAVAHAAGEALAERRFRGTEWFTRANSYYYIITGVGLLLVLFLAAHIVSMAGPWLGFLEGLLKFMAIMLTWAAFTVGFGAFLISRGGTRPGTGGTASRLEEEPHV